MKNLARKHKFAGFDLVDRPLSYVLEHRIMLDAAAVATGAEAIAESRAVQAAEAAIAADDGGLTRQSEQNVAEFVAALQGETETTGKTILAVDAGVEDSAELTAGISGEVEIIRIDAGSGGLEQLAAALQGRTDIKSLHLVSHGDAGVLNLGGEIINFASLTEAQTASLQAIKGAFGRDADILVYGCNFGAGLRGQAAVDVLAALTGADVAASNDVTGAKTKGADWDLEVAAGDIETEIVLTQAAQTNYRGVLAIAADLNGSYAGISSIKDLFEQDIIGVKYQNNGYIKNIDTDSWTDADPDTGTTRGEGNIGVLFADNTKYGVYFNFINAGTDDGSQVIVGFTADGKELVETWNDGTGVSAIDFGLYLENDVVHAFVNGDLTNKITLGSFTRGDPYDALAGIFVDSQADTITFTYDGSTAVADTSGTNDLTLDGDNPIGATRLDTSIYELNAGYRDMTVIYNGKNPLSSGARYVLQNIEAVDASRDPISEHNDSRVRHVQIVDFKVNGAGSDLLVGRDDGLYAYINNGDETFQVVTIDDTIGTVTGIDYNSDTNMIAVVSKNGDVKSFRYNDDKNPDTVDFSAATVHHAARGDDISYSRGGVAMMKSGKVMVGTWLDGDIGIFDGTNYTILKAGADRGVTDLLRVDGDTVAYLVKDGRGNNSGKIGIINEDGSGFTTADLDARPVDLAAGDLDGDGNKDFAVLDGKGNVYIFDHNLNPQGTKFTPTGVNTPKTLSIADFDDDGDGDIVIGGLDTSFQWYINKGTGKTDIGFTDADFAAATHSEVTNATAGAGSYNSDAGDLDGDGDADFVAAQNLTITGVDAITWVESVTGTDHHETSINGTEAHLADDREGAVIPQDDGNEGASAIVFLSPTASFTITLDTDASGTLDGGHEQLILGTDVIVLDGSGATSGTQVFGGVTVKWEVTATNVVTFTNNDGGDLDKETIELILQDIRYKNGLGAKATAGERVFDVWGGGAKSTIDVVIV